MSKLNFEVVEFGVKFTVIWNLRRYVDSFCQQNLHYPILSRKLFLFILCFFIIFKHFSLFQGHIILFLMWTSILGLTFRKKRKLAAIVWDASGEARQCGIQPHLHLLEIFQVVIEC